MQSFAAVAARSRASIWGVTLTVPGGARLEKIAKSPTKITRVQNEQMTGWVQRAEATFNFPASGSYKPTIGAEFTIIASATADEVSTVWRCFDLVRTGAGMEHTCTCFRLD